MTDVDLWSILIELRRDEERARAERIARQAAHPDPPRDYRADARKVISRVVIGYGARPGDLGDRLTPSTVERLTAQLAAMLAAGIDDHCDGGRYSEEVVCRWWNSAPLRCCRPTSRRGACQNAVEVEGRACHLHADSDDDKRSNGAPFATDSAERA
jgi:hypothetical protein